ncbi:UDP-N-acetylmuramate dehydrogenase [Mollicutes bacterium LVI A0039]|nr:UDP-N-acetylmuramate dehydrogenase [Mollicutes bacterium LVI A0039]
MLNDFKKFVEQNDLGELLENESMVHHTYVKTGGRVNFLYTPNSVETLAAAYKFIHDHSIKYYVIGRGSNLLFTDNPDEMVVIKLSKVIDHLEINGTTVVVGSGYSLQALSRRVSKLGLSGLEFAGGIPGAMGGSTFMNAGAHNGDLSQVITKVTTVTSTGQVKHYTNEQCKFSYRHSIFQENDDIIVEIALELVQDDVAKVFKRMSGNLEYRKEMQPLDKPSFGSAFRNPVGDHAGRLVEAVGLKGYKIGGAQVSEKHANFIINYDLASTKDIIDLIELAKSRVKAETGFDLETEVRIVK